MMRAGCIFVVAAALTAACGAQATPSTRVQVERVPNDGIQPQVAVDRNGSVHIVYFTGDPAAGDLEYVVRSADRSLSKPIRVNTEARSAIAIGSVRGAQVAVGRDGRVHVIWAGARAGTSGAGLPLFYTRLDPAARRFEPQRNLVTWADGVDGGGAVAADDRGRVFVTWHANPRRTTDAGRGVYVRRSLNDGQDFSPEQQADSGGGACACCAMRALATADGSLHVLYRSAGNDINRDMMLLSSADGTTFSSRRLDAWRVNICPLSTAALATDSTSQWAAWETDGKIRLDDLGDDTGPATVAPGSAPQKHPVLALNDRGDALLAWIEGSGWARGGTVAWRVYRNSVAATNESGTAGDSPKWGLLAAAALPDGRFLLLH